jgi:hypothetical protein
MGEDISIKAVSDLQLVDSMVMKYYAPTLLGLCEAGEGVTCSYGAALLEVGKFTGYLEDCWFMMAGVGKVRVILIEVSGKMMGALCIPASAARAVEEVWFSGVISGWLTALMDAFRTVGDQWAGTKLKCTDFLDLIQLHIEAAVFDETGVNIRQECQLASPLEKQSRQHYAAAHQ